MTLEAGRRERPALPRPKVVSIGPRSTWPFLPAEVIKLAHGPS